MARPITVDYRRVAEIYRRTQATGRPSMHIAEEMGTTPAAARAAVTRARQLGYLEAAERQGLIGRGNTIPKFEAVAKALGVDAYDLAAAVCKHADGDLRVNTKDAQYLLDSLRSEDEVLADFYLREAAS